jgi:RND family efflux transporter MFP subunit
MKAVHPNNGPDAADRGVRLDIGRKAKILAGIFSVALIVCFSIVHHVKSTYQVNSADAALKQASSPPLVNVITVQNAPPSSSLTLPGETAAWYDSTIYARVDGYVGSWKVDIGDHVKKGQVLATIETPDLDAKLVAAQAKLKAAQAVVVARQADADFARTTYERWKDSPKGVVSEQEREAKKAGHNSAIAQLNQAKAQVGLDQADVDRYTALTQFKMVIAPYDGTITERHIDIGNLVTAGNANTTPLYRMVKDDPIRVFSFVPQSAAGDIKIGAVARIYTNGFPHSEFIGKITRTANAIAPKTRTLRVEADIPNPDHTLVSGMYVNVEFQVPTEGLVQVPAAALVFRSEGPRVGLVDKDDHLQFHRVTIVRDNGDTLELGSGVSAGDRVALNISNQIADGDAVKVHELAEARGDVHKAAFELLENQ